MSEHRYNLRISESCVDPNPLMVERQDLDNFIRFQTQERCALEIAAYVFKPQCPPCKKRDTSNLVNVFACCVILHAFLKSAQFL